MLRKEITYTDFNGVERTEPFYFNFSKAELMEMDLTSMGGFENTVKAIIDANDTPSLIKIFKEFVLKAYGEKSPDGKRFMKVNDAGVPVARAFSESNAYSELFMELATDDVAAAEFINGIIPADVSKKALDEGLIQLPSKDN
jgi:hypothetical protein|uniref:Uncharacterized protein n=1 Tax=Siphoviridae sp. ctDS752 TaxID=2825386 RepID=A0A8S5U8C9_9CAUD|nr:MAG TPA: hypothetical protein [Siphoviridae sp. ctDS752]